MNFEFFFDLHCSTGDPKMDYLVPTNKLNRGIMIFYGPNINKLEGKPRIHLTDVESFIRKIYHLPMKADSDGAHWWKMINAHRYTTDSQGKRSRGSNQRSPCSSCVMQ